MQTLTMAIDNHWRPTAPESVELAACHTSDLRAHWRSHSSAASLLTRCAGTAYTKLVRARPCLCASGTKSAIALLRRATSGVGSSAPDRYGRRLAERNRYIHDLAGWTCLAVLREPHTDRSSAPRPVVATLVGRENGNLSGRQHVEAIDDMLEH